MMEVGAANSLRSPASFQNDAASQEMPNDAMKEAFDDIKDLDTKKMKKQLDKSFDDAKEKAEDFIDDVKK